MTIDSITRRIRFDAISMKPPQGSIAAGVTPDGKQLYTLSRNRSRPVPLTDEDGQRVWAKHPLTGEPLIPKNKPEFYTEEKLFYMEDEGNGNVRMQEYVRPTPEELEEERVRVAAKAMEGKLAEALVRKGVDSLDKLVNFLSGGNSAPKTGTPPQDVDDSPEVDEENDKEPEEITLGVPEHIGGPKWKLSNGETFKGNREAAEAAEQRIYEAKLEAATSPEY